MNQTQRISLLGRLRALIPQRSGVTFDESLRIAELQANHLVSALMGSDGITEAVLSIQARVHVVFEPLAVSGMTHWTGHEWLVVLDKADSPARQRFTLLHEFKHIVDHGSTSRLYSGGPRASAAEQAEWAADYFAGCALVPKRELKAAWGNGLQRTADLAAHFGVSVTAITVRLAQTKLSTFADEATDERCARPVSTPRTGPQQFRFARSRRTYA